MASLEIRRSDENDFHPVYGGVDWLALRLSIIARQGLEAGECWFVIEEEDGVYEQQITQENTHVSFNNINPDVDCVSIMDERDSEAWYWFRGDRKGTMPFDELVETIGQYAMRISSLYPRPRVAELYEQRQLRNLDADIEAGLEGLEDGSATTE